MKNLNEKKKSRKIKKKHKSGILGKIKHMSYGPKQVLLLTVSHFSCQSEFAVRLPALLSFASSDTLSHLFLSLFAVSDTDLGRSLATDGFYLYSTNSFGKGLSKLGSGQHGTLR